MAMEHVQTEYQKLKQLVENVTKVGEKMKKDGEQLLHDAEMAMVGNEGNAQALQNLEHNLRNLRVRVLSELTGITK